MKTYIYKKICDGAVVAQNYELFSVVSGKAKENLNLLKNMGEMVFVESEDFVWNPICKIPLYEPQKMEFCFEDVSDSFFSCGDSERSNALAFHVYDLYGATSCFTYTYEGATYKIVRYTAENGEYHACNTVSGVSKGSFIESLHFAINEFFYSEQIAYFKPEGIRAVGLEMLPHIHTDAVCLVIPYEGFKARISTVCLEYEPEVPEVQKDVLLDVACHCEDMFEQTYCKVKRVLVLDRDWAGDNALIVRVEYEGNLKEDSVFNLLHEDLFMTSNGRLVDVSPFRYEQTGTMEQYLSQLVSYGFIKKEAACA